MWPDWTHPLRPRKAHQLGLGLTIGILCAGAFNTPVRADEPDLPVLCHVKTEQGDTPAPQATDNCVEFGAAIGELSLDWRQKLPDQVRWITRKNAKEICNQTQNEWGQKVAAQLEQGCVFLSPKVCTIVTAHYISHAVLGNAVRGCAP